MQDAAGGQDASPVGLIGRLPLQVAESLGAQWPERPGVWSGNPRIVATTHTRRRNDNRLRVDVGTVLIVRRTGNDEAVLRGAAGVIILEDQARSLSLGVY